MNTGITFRKSIPVVAGFSLLALASHGSLAEKKEEIPLSVTEIFFELNNTDGDLGIHALVDGDPWDRMMIHDANGREILNIRVRGRLKEQGLTELFFESAEPPFESDDPEDVTLTPDEFFERFPDGYYDVEGRSHNGDRLVGNSEVTHVIPAAPVVQVNGLSAADDCDAELPIVSSAGPVTISWEPVTHSHAGIGEPGVLLDIHNYEVVVEIDETPYSAHAVLPSTTTEYVLPEEILSLGSEIKFEVLARESSYNQTAMESCFCIDACE